MECNSYKQITYKFKGASLNYTPNDWLMAIRIPCKGTQSSNIFNLCKTPKTYMLNAHRVTHTQKIWLLVALDYILLIMANSKQDTGKKGKGCKSVKYYPMSTGTRTQADPFNGIIDHTSICKESESKG